jgi:hypothetical protein
MNTRPKTYTIAAILLFIVNLVSVGMSLRLLPQGAVALDSVEGPGYVFVLIGLFLGLAGLLSAFGVWKSQKWGVILAIIISAINGLLALPGLIFAGGTLGWKIAAWWGVITAVAIIVLLLWPKAKPAPVSHNA